MPNNMPDASLCQHSFLYLEKVYHRKFTTNGTYVELPGEPNKAAVNEFRLFYCTKCLLHVKLLRGNEYGVDPMERLTMLPTRFT